MKYICLLTPIIILFLQCNPPTKTNIEAQNDATAYSNFLEQFKPISITKLFVYSNEATDEGEPSGYGAYKGHSLDSKAISLLPEAIQENKGDGIYACYRFKIDSSTAALIARTGSVYDASSIKLFLFNTKENRFLNYVELAESIGDAGYSVNISSWIIKTTKGRFQALVWKNESNDNSLEDSTDTTFSNFDSYQLIDLSNQLKLLSKDSLSLAQQAKELSEK